MRQANPAWKTALALFSLLLTIFVWTKGLEESFSRPSVTPKLSLRQHEIALLAEPAIPKSLKPYLIGEDPKAALSKTLNAFSLNNLGERETLLLAGLQQTNADRRVFVRQPFKDLSLIKVQKFLEDSPEASGLSIEEIKEAFDIREDPVLAKVICDVQGGKETSCLDSDLAKLMAARLAFSQLFPLFAVLFGVGLLIRQGWLFFRLPASSWPQMTALPLSLIDMLLLIAGGFVVLGEVLFPTLVAPLSEALTTGVASPIKESMKVVIGYGAMTLPPLLILRRQIVGLTNFERPDSGWFQWKIFPLDTAIRKAIKGWLMIMPLVLLTGWLMNLLVGDQGGSNPLLELVLRSRDPIALGLLILTTVVLAPLFEELVFRGALLPVLTREVGVFWGVLVSALVFAMAHLSVGELAPLTVLGLGLALLRLSSDRLFPCVLMHSLWNGVTFLNLLLLS